MNSHNTISKRIQSATLPIFNFSIYEKLPTIEVPKQLTINYNNHTRELANIQQQIQEIKKQQQLPNEELQRNYIHNVHHYSLGYFILVAIFIVVAIYFFKKKCFKKGGHQASTINNIELQLREFKAAENVGR